MSILSALKNTGKPAAVIQDTDLLNQQLGDSGRKRKKRNANTILGDATAQMATPLQTLLGA